jgi:hypothetical protein
MIVGSIALVAALVAIAAGASAMVVRLYRADAAGDPVPPTPRPAP